MNEGLFLTEASTLSIQTKSVVDHATMRTRPWTADATVESSQETRELWLRRQPVHTNLELYLFNVQLMWKLRHAVENRLPAPQSQLDNGLVSKVAKRLLQINNIWKFKFLSEKKGSVFYTLFIFCSKWVELYKIQTNWKLKFKSWTMIKIASWGIMEPWIPSV